MLRLPLIPIADGGFEYPITIHHPGPHAVHHLFGVLLALVSSDGGQQVFDQTAIGILSEFNGGTFEFAARTVNGGAKLDMRFDVASQTADIIDDDHMRLLALVLIEKGQQFFHLWAIQQTARDAFIMKHLNNVVLLVACEFTAPGLLRA